MNYLDRAKTALASVGISFSSEQTAVIPILDLIAKYDSNRVMGIAATLQQSSNFNAAVRDQIGGMEIAARYADITDGFNSIRDDAQTMAQWMADGRLDFKERIQLAWITVRRGSIPDRFNAIKSSYIEVTKSSNDQIQREGTILEAYRDFRMALKSAEVDAQDVLNIANAALQEKKKQLADAAAAIDGFDGQDQAQRSKLEFARDEALRALQDEDKAYQITKDLADDLKTSYNTAELLFARLQQTHAIKERLYQRSVSFFSTNEVVFSGLAASFTSMAGLGEATNTIEAMKDGMNKGLEALATTGNQQLEAGLKAGYGSTLKVSSVKALADAVVDFQSSNIKLIEQLRLESTQTSKEIEAATEDAKQRFAALLNKGV